jgi:signal transduction histidine kinase
MPLRNLALVRKTLTFRLTVGYAAIFMLSTVALYVVSYIFLSSSLQDHRIAIESKLNELVSRADAGGIEAIERAAEPRPRANRRSAFFVRVLDKENRVVFLNDPRLWEIFDIEARPVPAAEGAWEYLASRGHGDILELTAASLPNGYLLQVGKTFDNRAEILKHYRETSMAVIMPMILLALGGGALFAFRVVRPIRNLVDTTQAIVATGQISVRVPETGTNGELAELVGLFNKMLERIEGLVKGMRDALDNVAHDLRTPMTRLRGIGELTLVGEPDPRQCREALVTCIEESERILTLLNSLMDISEAEAGTMRLHREAIDLADLVQEIVGLYQYVAESKDIAIHVECGTNIKVTADRVRMRQVVANLVDNALKYTEPGGHVTIRARQDGEQVLIAVRDSGAGIPPGEICDIWTRLYRGDRSRSQPGLGLGLSLVKAIVQAHEGQVDVQSEPGMGSIFTLRLPVTSASRV